MDLQPYKRNYDTKELERIHPLPTIDFMPSGFSCARRRDVNIGQVSSVDSGVETGNDSNDSIVTQMAKNQIRTASFGLYCEPNEYNQMAIMRLHSLPTSESSRQSVSTNCNADDIDQPQSSLSSDDRTTTRDDTYAIARTMEAVYPDRTVDRDNRIRQEKSRFVARNRYQGSAAWMRRAALDRVLDVKGRSQKERRMRLAAATNNVQAIEELLAWGITPNNSDKQGRTPLHFAAGRGYTEVVDLLLKHGAEANRKDAIGNTPLHLATVTSKLPVVSLLLGAGTDPLSPDDHGYSPLQLAKLNLQFVQKSRGGDVNQVKSDIHEVVNMITAFLKNRQRGGDDRMIDALTSSCSDLGLSDSAYELQKIRDAVNAQIDKIFI